MSKPNRRRFKLAEVRQRHAEAIGGDVIEIETASGQVFELPAPGFWSDDAKECFSANREIDGVKLLMGTREYLKFREAGGRGEDVALVLKEFGKEQGVDLGESPASQRS